MKKLLTEWRKFLAEAKEIKVQEKSNGFTLDVYDEGKHIGQYTHTREEDSGMVRNFAEVFPEHRGKGYGTIMLLAAIKAARDLGIDFEEDSQSLTPAMSRRYDELYDSGFIYGGGGAWTITPAGEDELEEWSSSGEHK